MANTFKRDAWFGCELWTGSRSSSGYGTHWQDGKPRLAHYVAWERAHGPVAGNRVLDHLCRRPLCRAIAHLEPISQGENMRRRRWGHRSQLTKCPKGHDLWQNGRRTPEGGIICRICSGVWTPADGR